MAKHKYKRKAASPFLRTSAGGTKPGSSILVVTEGKNTEPVYFKEIRKFFSSNVIELVTSGEGKGDPEQLTEAAIRIRNERKRKAKNKKLRINQLEDFDEVWIVFDTDVLTPEKRNSGIQYAESKNIKVAYSEPCFEYWLLLHSEKGYTTANMKKCADVIPHLKKAYGWSSYQKNKDQTEKLVAPLVTKTNIERAINASKRVRDHHKKVGNTFPTNPSTDIDLLIKSINDTVPISNKIKT